MARSPSRYPFAPAILGACLSVMALAGCHGGAPPEPILPTQVDATGLARMMGDGLPLTLCDVRTSEQFAVSHITGSECRPLADLAVWAADLDPAARVVCVGATGAEGRAAAEGLIAAGHSRVSWLLGGMPSWDGPVEVVRQDITTGQLQDMIAAGASIQLCDVRTAAEYAAGHIPGAVNLPHVQVDTWAAALVKQQPVVCICAAGSRSRTAADALIAKDFHLVYNVLGGIAAWGGALER